MKKLKTQKGITLVALIITIVVLLILAVVSIGVVQNSDIIGHATDAAKGFDKSKENEVDALKKTEEYIGQYEGDKGVVPEELSKYILGKDGKGRSASDILDLVTLIAKQDPQDATSTVHEKVKISHIEGNETYFRYNRDVYKVKFSTITYESEEIPDKLLEGTLVKVNSPEGNLGKYVTYANNTWIVLRDDANGVELISANTVGTVDLGSNNNYEDARSKYNDEVSMLVKSCKDNTGITSNIRSVGSKITQEEDLTENNTVNFRTLNTFDPVTNFRYEDFEDINDRFRMGDTNYKTDYEQMVKLGILATDTPSKYCFASRFVVEEDFNVDFYVRRVNYSIFSGYCVYSINGDGMNGFQEEVIEYGVRAVVTLEKGILNGATQSGLANDPIVIN